MTPATPASSKASLEIAIVKDAKKRQGRQPIFRQTSRRPGKKTETANGNSSGYQCCKESFTPSCTSPPPSKPLAELRFSGIPIGRNRIADWRRWNKFPPPLSTVWSLVALRGRPCDFFKEPSRYGETIGKTVFVLIVPS